MTNSLDLYDVSDPEQLKELQNWLALHYLVTCIKWVSGVDHRKYCLGVDNVSNYDAMSANSRKLNDVEK